MNSNRFEYFNRDLSWLSFNYRVLEEAKDKTNPLYERIKFLAIYSNNLEEFYKVRVSYYRQLLNSPEQFDKKIKEINPARVIKEINAVVSQHQTEFNHIFKNEIVPELKENNIYILDSGSRLNDEQEEFVKQIFMQNLLSSIQPMMLIKQKIRPFLKTGQVYIALELLTRPSVKNGLEKKSKTKYGLIKIPTDHGISRFIELPEADGKFYIMFIEDIIIKYLDKLYPGYQIKNWYAVKMTRDADFEYDNYEGEDLIDAIENLDSSRSLGNPNRFQYAGDMPRQMIDFLIKSFYLKSNILVKGGTYQNFRDFFGFPNPLSPKLERQGVPPLQQPELDKKSSLYVPISKKDYILNFPYQSYEYFIRFLEQAANDNTVDEIFATQYRVASRSAVVHALINAAQNGKRVTVFVELKARFDEEANLRYASEMKKAGVKIIYSIPGFKVHAKVALVTRKDKYNVKLKDQAFLGTGNFNENTARIYGDHGLFTSNIEIINDLKEFFNYLQDQDYNPNFKHIIVPLFNLRDRFTQLIQQEIEHVKNGKKGYIILKMNGLQDLEMVNELYKASMAGVKIDLIIRGICILKTGKPYSENINVIRIIDSYLEHARVFYFANDSDPQVYLGSADWMKRNLNKRIECIFPLYNKENIYEIVDILKIQLSDNVKACTIDDKMNNVRVTNDKPPIRSQEKIYHYLKDKYPRKVKKL